MRDPIFQGVKSNGDPKMIDPGVRDKRSVIVETEFSSALRMAKRPENILTPLLRNAFDSKGKLETLVKNNPAKATNAHISVVAHITPDELIDLLDHADMANGFANRFSFFAVRRSKLIPLPDSFNAGLTAKLREISTRLRKALDFGREEQHLDWDAEARELWKSVYRELTEPAPGLLGAILARGHVHTMRLSMIYAALDCSPVIEAQHLQAALAVWRYASGSATFIFGNKLGNPDADTIHEEMKRAKNGLTRTAIYDLFNRHLSSSRIANALLMLEKAGLARREEVRGKGRPAEVWFAEEFQTKNTRFREDD